MAPLKKKGNFEYTGECEYRHPLQNKRAYPHNLRKTLPPYNNNL
jgi:hypothetical protein